MLSHISHDGYLKWIKINTKKDFEIPRWCDFTISRLILNVPESKNYAHSKTSKLGRFVATRWSYKSSFVPPCWNYVLLSVFYKALPGDQLECLEKDNGTDWQCMKTWGHTKTQTPQLNSTEMLIDGYTGINAKTNTCQSRIIKRLNTNYELILSTRQHKKRLNEKVIWELQSRTLSFW